MSFPFGQNPLQQYQQVRNADAVSGLNPNQLIQILMQAALERIATAKGCLLRGDVARKGEQISRVIGILDGLRASLNTEAGGELAERLEALYHYMERRLLHANLHNDVTALDEVSRLLDEIKSAWDTITAAPAEMDAETHDRMAAAA